MNKIVIANIIMFIYLVGGFYADTRINRRQCTKLWMILHIVNAIASYMLGARSSMYGSMWASCKFAIVLYILHKDEEKIIQSPLEAGILGSPYLIIAILNW